MTDVTSAKKIKVVVVGGGIGGCTAAIALHRAGADVTVYEQAAELKEIGAGINVQAVAIAALADLGISPELLNDPEHADGIRTSKVQYYTSDGLLISEEMTGTAAGSSHPQFSLHRAKFHSTLVNECIKCLGEDKVFLNSSFDRLEQTEGKVMLHLKKRSTGEDLPVVECDFLIGCDGLKSRVRAALLGDGLPRYTGRTIYRGLCEVDDLIGDGMTVSLCGNYDNPGNFICYPISERCRQTGKTLCNWAFVAHRSEPKGVESWTNMASIEDIRSEVECFNGNRFGGLTPLQMAERTESIIGWALFDREPLETFDFGSVTLLGDAAHPLLPFGSQGATQAIMDAEALGVSFANAVEAGKGVRGVVQEYSRLRCEFTGKVVITNRGMGPTRVLQVAEEKCKDMTREEKAAWIEAHGAAEAAEVISSYRKSMPKSVRPVRSKPY